MILVTVVLQSFSNTSARAERGAFSVFLEIQDCPTLKADEVRRILAVELRAVVLTRRQADAAAVALVRCRGGKVDNGQVELFVDDLVTRKTLSRIIDITHSASIARSRIIALSVAEIVTASWAELLLDVEEAALRPQGSSEVSAGLARQEVIRKVGPRPHLSAFGATRSWQGRWATWGLGVRMAASVARKADLVADWEWQEGSVANPLGRVGARSMGLGLSIQWRAQFSSVRTSAGVGGRFHQLRLTGEPRPQTDVRGETVQGLVLGPVATGGLRWDFYRKMAVHLTGEVGYLLSPLVGEGLFGEEVRAGGPFFGASVGFGLDL